MRPRIRAGSGLTTRQISFRSLSASPALDATLTRNTAAPTTRKSKTKPETKCYGATVSIRKGETKRLNNICEYCLFP